METNDVAVQQNRSESPTRHVYSNTTKKKKKKKPPENSPLTIICIDTSDEDSSEQEEEEKQEILSFYRTPPSTDKTPSVSTTTPLQSTATNVARLVSKQDKTVNSHMDESESSDDEASLARRRMYIRNALVRSRSINTTALSCANVESGEQTRLDATRGGVGTKYRADTVQSAGLTEPTDGNVKSNRQLTNGDEPVQDDDDDNASCPEPMAVSALSGNVENDTASPTCRSGEASGPQESERPGMRTERDDDSNAAANVASMPGREKESAGVSSKEVKEGAVPDSTPVENDTEHDEDGQHTHKVAAAAAGSGDDPIAQAVTAALEKASEPRPEETKSLPDKEPKMDDENVVVIIDDDSESDDQVSDEQPVTEEDNHGPLASQVGQDNQPSPDPFDPTQSPLGSDFLSSHCWDCHVPLKETDGVPCLYTMHVHPLLRVPVCCVCAEEVVYALQCQERRASGERPHGDDTNLFDTGIVGQDETTAQECSGCGVEDGVELYLCDSCPRAFCQKCIKQANDDRHGNGENFASAMAELENETADWECIVCKPPSVLGNFQIALDSNEDQTEDQAEQGNSGDGMDKNADTPNTDNSQEQQGDPSASLSVPDIEDEKVLVFVEKLIRVEDALVECDQQDRQEERLQQARLFRKELNDNENLPREMAEARIEEELEVLEKQWDDHHTRLQDSKTDLLEKLNRLGITDKAFYDYYTKERPSVFPTDSGGENTPSWRQEAEKKMDERLRQQEELNNRSDDSDNDDDDDDDDRPEPTEAEILKDVEDLVTETEFKAHLKSLRKKKTRMHAPSKNQILEALLNDNDKLKTIGVTVEHVEEADDNKAQGLEESLVTSTRDGVQVRRDEMINLVRVKEEDVEAEETETAQKTTEETHNSVVDDTIPTEETGLDGNDDAEQTIEDTAVEEPDKSTELDDATKNEKSMKKKKTKKRAEVQSLAATAPSESIEILEDDPEEDPIVESDGTLEVTAFHHDLPNKTKKRTRESVEEYSSAPAAKKEKKPIPQANLVEKRKVSQKERQKLADVPVPTARVELPLVTRRKYRSNRHNDEDFDASSLELAPGTDDSGPVQVATQIAKRLKDHQVDGVRFMWKNVFCDLVSTKPPKQGTDGTTAGGCILAHHMGLGKTLQVISLLHTAMFHPALRKQTASGNVEPFIRSVLLVVPVNTVANWENELELWTEELRHRFTVFSLQDAPNVGLRQKTLRQWAREGGILLSGSYMLSKCLSGKDEAARTVRYNLCID